MHSAYCVVPLGTPNSLCVVDCPFTHFHTSLSLLSGLLSLRSRIDLSAVRQPPCGLPSFTQPLIGLQESCVQRLWSSQSRAVPGLQTPAPLQVSSPLQRVASGHGVPGGSNLQVDEQQSPFKVLPSSQSSLGSI